MRKKYKSFIYQSAQRSGKTATLEHIVRFANSDKDVHAPGVFTKALKNMEAQKQFDKLNNR